MAHRYIPYGRQWITEDDVQAVAETLRGDWITQGPRVAEFEEALADYCGAKYAVAVSSGTAALHLAALAANFGPSEEIITSPITFVATANSILYVGAKPVFADIDPDTICIAPSEIEKELTPATKGLIPVHFAGYPCDMPAIWEMAKKNNLVVIEDACHALGAEYSHERTTFRIGSCAHSHMACFSFHPVKHITTGEGGAITTNNKDLYQKLVKIRNHGITKDTEYMERKDGPWYYEMHDLGFNYRITDFQCALGSIQLQRIHEFIRRRKEIAANYNRAFVEEEELILSAHLPNSSPSWHLYVIQLKTLDRLVVFNRLQENGIGVQVHYIPIHFQPYYIHKFGFKKGDFPKAEKYYERAISIPLFPGMSDVDVDYVIRSVAETITELSE